MVNLASFFTNHGDHLVPFPANSPTVDDLPGLGLQDIVQLPVELLAILQRDLDERIKRDKGAKARFDTALAVRYATRAAEARRACGKDTGTIRIVDGDYTVIADLPKRVDWDQDKLARIAADIAATGRNPSDFIDTMLKVSERKYVALPEDWRKGFEPARTVGHGQPSFRLEVADPS